MISLSQDQNKALQVLLKWFELNNKSFITLGGYAGTGKTTLISILRSELNKKNKSLSVSFCSYTGKATRVLKNKINEGGVLFPQDNISTIHSLIYSPIVNDSNEITGWERKKKMEYDLIIVDEASMIDQEIWSDLLRYKTPIIAVGDHGQLPPIRGNFNLIENPDVKLEEIHRQAKDNPIIELSIQAREKGEIKYGKFGNNVVKLARGSTESQETIGELLQNYKKDTLILCGYNNTRIKLNKYIRQALGFETNQPEVNDRVICLRNNHDKEIFNGMLGTIKSISREDNDPFYSAKIQMDDENGLYKGLISVEQFNNSESMAFSNKKRSSENMDLFDFGYALTVHKAQGSQSKRVILFEERFKQMDESMWKKWLYTAITRAESELFIVG